jgi:hypothetical protein
MGYGAMPPPNLRRQIGANAASIKFVNDAEKALVHWTMRAEIAETLKKRIVDIKAKQEILLDEESVEEYISKQYALLFGNGK